MSDDELTLYRRTLRDAATGVAPVRITLVMSRRDDLPPSWWLILPTGESRRDPSRERLLGVLDSLFAWRGTHD